MARPAGEPTEQPTPRRLLRARQRGQVAVSRDLSAGLGLLALVLALSAAVPAGLAQLLDLFRGVLSSLGGGASRGGTPSDFAARASDVVALALAPLPLLLMPLAAGLVVSVIAGVWQTQGLFVWRGGASAAGGAGPAAWAGRFTGPRLWFDLGRALMLVVVVLAVSSASIGSALLQLPRLAGARPQVVLATFGVLAERLGFCLAAALVSWGIADWLLARRRHRQALMLTRAEARREHKDVEGDPRHREHRRRLHREIGEQRGAHPMLEDVRRADLMVVGPDHIAVALTYDAQTDAAPLVAAKGERLVAQRMQQVARESGVPIHRDARLAHALHQLPAGEEIPRILYDAVARALSPAHR